MDARESLFKITERLLQETLQGISYAKRKGLRSSVKAALRSTIKHGLPLERIAKALTDNKEQSFKKSWSQLAKRDWPSLMPLRLFSEGEHGESYTTVVTDSIEGRHLIDGVRSAVVLGTLLANRRKQPLRIITRTEEASAETYRSLIEAQDISLDHELILNHDPASGQGLGVSHSIHNFYITTSWWNTYSCLQRISASQILFVLQEDERYSLPHGDLRIQCETVLRNEQISFAIGSRLLWDHLISEGFMNIARRGTWFEPATPMAYKAVQPESLTCKKKLVVYLNSDDSKSLNRMSLSAINSSLVTHCLSPSEWDIILIDDGLEEFSFDDGTTARLVVNPTLTEYLSLVSEADVGLALIAGPHPGFPPLDLAAAGSVVVTNNYGNKSSLASYSENILCVDPSLEDLQRAIYQAVEAANNMPSKQNKEDKCSLPSSWSESFAKILDQNS